jgi:flavin-dependent thymidylate synthase
MKVTLAGYNVEHEFVKQAGRRLRAELTPETIAAAYARISRSTKPVDELRREARKELERARKSNETIVFDMGHHSIAEHAVFNFDVLDVSRLAAEALEHHRLAAFTEKSQRYVRLSDEFTVPVELQNSDLQGEYLAVIRAQNRYYQELMEKLVPHFREKRPELANQPQQLEALAKEDARYITCLATQTQLGMTLNARNLELMLRRLAASELAETRALSEALYREAFEVAPSLLVFTGPTDYDRKTYPRLREYATAFMAPAFPRRPRNFIAMSASDVTLVDYSQNSDNKLLAAVLHTTSRASYAECLSRAERQTLTRKREIVKLVWQDMQAYDAVLREFEHLYLTFELVISASCFAQLKRHRLATLTVQPYNPNLGWTIPNSIAEVKEHRAFKEMLARTEEVYDKLAATSPAVAQYVLTNSHQRRVLLTLDARELYHVARLREDMAAQWDIRDIVSRMVEQARNVMPLTLTLASGKDGYPRVYQELYGRPPAVEKLELPRARPIAVSSRAAPKPRGRKAGR